MKLRQLEAFNALMQTGTVSQAAELMHLTQPAVSKLISNFEQYIGINLFERRKGRIVITSEAQYLYNDTRIIFESLRSLSQSVEKIRDLEKGFLRILSMTGQTLFVIPKVLNDIVGGDKNVKVSLTSRHSARVIDWMSTQQYDIGIAEMPAQKHGVEIETFVIQCCCAVPLNHPLAAEPVITPKHLHDLPMIALHPESRLRHDIQRAFAQAESHLNVWCDATLFLSAFTLIENNQGMAIVDSISAYGYRHFRGEQCGVAFKRFEPEMQIEIGMLFPVHRPRSLLVQEFSRRLISELKLANEAMLR